MNVRSSAMGTVFTLVGFATPCISVQAGVIVGRQVRVDQTNGFAAAETAIVASRVNPLEVLAGAMDLRNAENFQLGYGISLDGGKTWLDGVLQSPPELGDPNHADPMIATNPQTGDFWIGALTLGLDGNNNGVFVARKRAGSTDFDPAVAVTNTEGTEFFDDKPLIAAGPDPVDPEQINVYVTWSRFVDVGVLPPLMVARSTDGGQVWSDPIPTGAIGQGAAPVVLLDGRLVMSYSNFKEAQIFAVYSDDAGTTWSSPTSVSGVIDWVQPFDVPGGFYISTLPGIAVDPRKDDLYVAYQARSDFGSSNVDVFIARSLDGGESFETVVRIPDPDPPSDQFFPWVAIDQFGGVNVLWYDTRNVKQSDGSDEAWLDAYYARITDFGSPNEQIEEHRLTADSFFTNIDFGHAWIGDYQQITASGNFVYPCYMSTHEGHQHVYAHRIEVSVTGDIDGDGVVGASDLLILLVSWGPCADCNDCPADLNGDCSVGAADLLILLVNWG